MAKTTKTLKKTATKPAAPSAPATNPAPMSATKPAVPGAPVSPGLQAALSKSSPVAPTPAAPATTAARPARVAVETPLPKPASAAPIPNPLPPKSVTSRSNRICLELVKPEAKSVYVAGSFNEWNPDKTPLSPAGNGRWVGDLAIKPGRHEYLFVVDGQWLPDPNAKETVGNPFGGKNSVLVVSE